MLVFSMCASYGFKPGFRSSNQSVHPTASHCYVGGSLSGPCREEIAPYCLLEKLVLLGLRLPLGFGEGFDAVSGVFELLARQEFRNGQDL